MTHVPAEGQRVIAAIPLDAAVGEQDVVENLLAHLRRVAPGEPHVPHPVLVHVDDPLATLGGRQPSDQVRHLVDGLGQVLDGGCVEERVPVERTVDGHVVGVCVDGGHVPVRVDHVEIGSHLLEDGHGIVVLLGEVPLEAVEVAEARRELAEEELALEAHRPVVEPVLVADLGLGEDEMNEDALLLCVVEDRVPLVEATDVVVGLVVSRLRVTDERARVLTVPRFIGRK